MTNQQLEEVVKRLGVEAVISEAQFLTVEVPFDKLFDLARNLKENEQTQMDYLILITGVDYVSSFGCTYLLSSTTHNHYMVLKTRNIDKANPRVDSVTSLWQTAEYHEREIYDLMGITFNNHPDMRRMFLDESWVGHPLRKDYVDESNIIERKY
jgi:NADH:ubiquinone oxidoreductase subunit C